MSNPDIGITNPSTGIGHQLGQGGGGPTSITLKNASGAIVRVLTVTDGIATLAATDTIVSDGAVITVRNSTGVAMSVAAATVANGLITQAALPTSVALVNNGDSLVLQTNAGVVSSGTAGLNSPAAAIVAAGVITAVKAAA